MEECRIKKSPGGAGAFFLTYGSYCLDPGDVRSLKTFRSLDDVERYAITFNKGFESVAGDGGEVAKYVFAVLLLKKTKPLAVVKPFYSTICHFCLPSPDLSSCNCPDAPDCGHLNSTLQIKQAI